MDGFKFEKLTIWDIAMALGEEFHLMAKSFPNEERYNLSSQIRKASDSIALNIAEGSILQSNKEYQKFLGYSIRSLAEVVTCLYKAKNRNYITEKEFSEKYQVCFKLMNMIIALRKKLKN